MLFYAFLCFFKKKHGKKCLIFFLEKTFWEARSLSCFYIYIRSGLSKSHSKKSFQKVIPKSHSKKSSQKVIPKSPPKKSSLKKKLSIFCHAFF